MINSSLFTGMVDCKKYSKYVIVVAIVVAAFLSGRYFAPEKVHTVTQTVYLKDTTTQNTEAKQDTKIVTQYVDRPVDRVVTRTIIKEPSGKTTETTTESTHQGNTVINTTKDDKKETKVQVKTEIVYKEKLVEKEVIKTRFNAWEIGVGAGYSLSSKNTASVIPGLPDRVMLQVEGGYGIMDWLKVKAFANSRGDVGALVGIEF